MQSAATSSTSRKPPPMDFSSLPKRSFQEPQSPTLEEEATELYLDLGAESPVPYSLPYTPDPTSPVYGYGYGFGFDFDESHAPHLHHPHFSHYSQHHPDYEYHYHHKSPLDDYLREEIERMFLEPETHTHTRMLDSERDKELEENGKQVGGNFELEKPEGDQAMDLDTFALLHASVCFVFSMGFIIRFFTPAKSLSSLLNL